MFSPVNMSTSRMTSFSESFNRSRKSRGHSSIMIADQTSECILSSYGQSLPVLVTEAITLADQSAEMTARFDAHGWAWLVVGRKLFVWRYKTAATSTRATQCKELTLPPSDLAHNANRVVIIAAPNDSQPPACVSVSPEGIIRYWSNITQENYSVEISAELKGEECATVVAMQPGLCILGTTTSSLLLVSISLIHNTVSCRPLKATQGMLSGFSRRMSSFFFGSTPAQMTGAPLHRLLPCIDSSEGHNFFVLSGTLMQKWHLTETQLERVVFQAEVGRLFREALASKVWGSDSSRIAQLKIWLMDIQITGNGVLVLGAGWNLEVSQALYYGLGLLSISEEEPPKALDHFFLINYAETYQEDLEPELLSYSLLVPDPSTPLALLHNYKQVLIVPGVTDSGTSQPVDKVEFTAPGERLIGAGVCNRTAVLFSNNCGLFSITRASQQETSMLESFQDETITGLYPEMKSVNLSTNQAHKLSLSSEKSDRFKAAFLLFCKTDMEKAQEVIDTLFPCEDAVVEVGSELDNLVVNLSRDIIDDYPVQDPRWADGVKKDSAMSTHSLIIQQQLKDKHKAHDYLVTFLRRLQLWERLTMVHVRESWVSTRLHLCENVEKIVATCALREMHSQYSGLIDNSIKHVLDRRQEDKSSASGLLPQDLFYREVSRIEEIVSALIDYEESMMNSLTSKDLVNLISSISTVLQGMFHEAIQYRREKLSFYEQQVSDDDSQKNNYLPWTAGMGKNGCRTLLFKQFDMIITRALPEEGSVESQGTLYQQALGLADFVLDAYCCHLEFVRHSEGENDTYRAVLQKYEQDRSQLIRTFLSGEQYEHATSLAEKYYDFTILIEICEKLQAPERLEKYCTHFSEQGFSEELFRWYIKEGKRGRLLCQPFMAQTKLSQFLEQDNNKYLSWLQHIGNNNYEQAHRVLLDLGVNEKESSARKKTLLSLSKLAALASEEPPADMDDKMDMINEEHTVLQHQDDLPLELLERLGMEADKMRVLSPEELIELYVNEENDVATEYDFKKALDLLNFIKPGDSSLNVADLRLHIWCQALLRDRWNSLGTDNPLQSLQQTIFFRTVELAANEGMELLSFVPRLDTLLAADELGTTKSSTNFQFLIRACYEQITSVIEMKAA